MASCVSGANAGYLTQPDLIDPPRIPIPTDGSTLTALVYRLITYLEDESLRELPSVSRHIHPAEDGGAGQVAVIPNPLANITCAQAAQVFRLIPRRSHDAATHRLTASKPVPAARPRELFWA
jgi:hypothetical protein